MILAISGKKQSGKDLIGKIIQNIIVWNNTPIKEDCVEDVMLSLNMFINHTSSSGWQIKRFGDKLKQICSILTGISVEDFEKEEVKNSLLGKKWTKTIRSVHTKYLTKPVSEYSEEELDNIGTLITIPMKVRDLLVQIGMGMRKTNPDVWVDALFADYIPLEYDIKKSNIYSDNRLHHGYNKTRIFRIYHNIKQRCYNPKHPRYESYGGKGIVMCDNWLNSLDSFVIWANSNGYQENLTIDRVDNNLGYCPENCRWVSYSTQAINQGLRKDNTSGYKGVSKDKHNWRADIQFIGDKKFLGYFNSAEQAADAYEEAFMKRENIYKEKESLNLKYPSWCITDVRFPNEAKAIKDRGGLLIRVNRLNSTPQDGHIFVPNKDRTHPSETSLDNYEEFDYVIKNEGTIEELIEKVREILIKEKII